MPSSSQNAHAWGLCWFENTGGDASPSFRRHAILTADPADNPRMQNR